MIVEFKSKEQIKIDAVMKTAEMFKGREKERYIRLETGVTESNDRLFWSNMLVDFKMQLVNKYKDLEKYRKEIWSFRDFMEDKETAKYVKLLRKLTDSIDNSILAIGSALVNIVFDNIDKHFTLHEITQLIGANDKDIEVLMESHERIIGKPVKTTFEIIFHHGEYRHMKGRCKDFIDCPLHEMPLFNCVSDYVFKRIEENPQAREDTNNYIIGMMDDAANTKEVTLKEILEGYKNTSFLQNEVVDLNKKYKVKKTYDKIYEVIEEGNVLGTIIKL